MDLVAETGKALQRLKPGSKLTEFQAKAIRVVEETDDNILVIAPTGSGKTIIGVSALIKHGRGFYLAPLRSLMAEKYLELRKMLPEKNIIITNKDYSIPRRVFKNSDIRVLSPYKMMLYLSTVEPSDGVVIVDEIHEIKSNPDIEAVVTALKQDGFRIIGLSATIRDDDATKLSMWLKARVVKSSEERPVPLKYVEVKLDLNELGFVVVDGAGYIRKGEVYATKQQAIASLVSAILQREPDAGVMVWCPTRADADEYARVIAKALPVNHELANISQTVHHGGDHDRALSITIPHGVAIHHGGVSPRNRELVEELFRQKKVKVVVTCFTLSHGVNFPVRYVIITDVFNFDGKPLDPSTFHQLAGRAGRPGLDSVGVVITVTVGDLESFLLSKVVSEKASKITSKLHNEWTLTKIVAQRLAVERNLDKIGDFIYETYYVIERGQSAYEEIRSLVEEVTTRVVDAYFVLEGNTVKPKNNEAWHAARLGLHPREWNLSALAILGNYRTTVREVVNLSAEITGVDDEDVKETVVDYGLLAGYFGGWKARELADTAQSVLDALALYARVAYGYRSTEFENSKKIAELFSYGGNPRVETLVKVLRHDEMKRLCRNLPSLFTAEHDAQSVLKSIPYIVDLVFGMYKRISITRLMKVTDAVLEMTLDTVPESVKKLAHKLASETARKIASERGAVIVK